MIEDELNYPNTMRKRFLNNEGRQEYNKWVDKTELGRHYNVLTERFSPVHIYCYPSSSEPSAAFICVGQCKNNYFYIKRNKLD